METDAEGGDLLISDHWSDSSCMHLVSFYEDDIWLFLNRRYNKKYSLDATSSFEKRIYNNQREFVVNIIFV
jgi:hypothetical protein